MVDLQPEEVALGAIFDYPHPIDAPDLLDWLQDRGFEEDPAYGTREYPLEGIEHGYARLTQARIASRDSLSILFNPNANLAELPECAFLTVRDEEGDFSFISDELPEFLDDLTDLDLAADITVYELTVEGKIRVGSDHKLNRLFNEGKLDDIHGRLGGPPSCGAVEFHLESPGAQDEWYRLILDSNAYSNPKLWRVKYVERFDSPGDIGFENVRERVEETVDLCGGE